MTSPATSNTSLSISTTNVKIISYDKSWLDNDPYMRALLPHQKRNGNVCFLDDFENLPAIFDQTKDRDIMSNGAQSSDLYENCNNHKYQGRRKKIKIKNSQQREIQSSSKNEHYNDTSQKSSKKIAKMKIAGKKLYNIGNVKVVKNCKNSNNCNEKLRNDKGFCNQIERTHRNKSNENRNTSMPRHRKNFFDISPDISPINALKLNFHLI